MHPEALRGVRDMIEASGADLRCPDRSTGGPIALDIGGADVNGSARRWFPDNTAWFGLDIAPAPGVDIVTDATTWRGQAVENGPYLMLPAFDIVLCTEMFEHVEKWPLVLDTIHAALVKGGHAFITFASEGRRPHGARGEHDVPAGEWYRNVSRTEFAQAVVRGPAWSDLGIVYNANPGDIYAWLRK